MCVLWTVIRRSIEEKRNKRINIDAISSPSLSMNEKAEPKRNVPSGIIF